VKNYRLLAVISILFLVFFVTGCARHILVTPKKRATPAVKAIDKSVKPQEVVPSKAVPAEVKPPEIIPSKVKPPDVLPTPSLVNRDIVGCVFPLTGRFASEGSKALDAVLLASKLFNKRSPSPWKIAVADSGGSPEKVKEAVAYLADEVKVMAIIAMTGTAEATDAAREAQRRQVPLILIASKEGVTNVGEYVFQHFLTPSQQIETLVKYAQSALNVAIFSVLYPQDDYGEEMVHLFRKEAQKIGGKVKKAIPYHKTQVDFGEQINNLAENKIGTIGKVYTTNEEARNRLPIDFEAIFIPDSALRVKMITSQLSYHDIKVKLLGTSLWHSPDLMKKGVKYLESAVFVDSFFINGFLPQTNDFVDIYYSAYRREPGNIEALSYDTTEIVLGILEDRRIKTRAEFMGALLAVQSFRGATGSITFGGNRVAQKEAFILQVQNGKLVQVR